MSIHPRFSLPLEASRNDEARDAIIAMDSHWNLVFVVHIVLEARKVYILAILPWSS